MKDPIVFGWLACLFIYSFIQNVEVHFFSSKMLSCIFEVLCMLKTMNETWYTGQKCVPSCSGKRLGLGLVTFFLVFVNTDRFHYRIHPTPPKQKSAILDLVHFTDTQIKKKKTPPRRFIQFKPNLVRMIKISMILNCEENI